jgi:arylformamidase
MPTMNDAAVEIRIRRANRSWRADLDAAQDLSIPLRFDAPQPSFFGAPDARSTAFQTGDFTGSVALNASCNCSTYTLTPHCNGTHTECVGHITRERVSVRDVGIKHVLLTRLISVSPQRASTSSEATEDISRADDLVITNASLGDKDLLQECDALIVRTLPNDVGKLQRRYEDSATIPYFSVAAMQSIVQAGISHLIVDLPSVDRADDAGRLLAHRMFWGVPPGETRASSARRPDATITELAYIPDAVIDGWYALNLQIAPFHADAAPSRPIVYPLLAI